MDDFQSISPIDFRYYGRNPAVFEALSPYLSEEAMIKHMVKVEVALTKVLEKKGIAPKGSSAQLEKAAESITAKEVYEEEDRIKHNVRALVNVLKKNIDESAKPFVHFGATSHDIICTADALRFKEFTKNALLPQLKSLISVLSDKALEFKETVQIGRTHGQHAEPVTFGYVLAGYVDRLGGRWMRLKDTSENLRGKLSGAVGAYNSTSIFTDGGKLEEQTLELLGLKPARHATQIVEPEYMTDYVTTLISTFGVLADMADDMRHLQRSEISEVGEAFGKDQVGSSTMPHKRNPISFENIKSLWKSFMPRATSVFMDQLSEHQRDLTNSASSRWFPEISAALYVAITRMEKSMSKLVVDAENMKTNFEKSASLIVAEPMYLLLASQGHPDAHEAVRKLAQKARVDGTSLIDVAMKDPDLGKYLKKAKKEQLGVLKDPGMYIGLASKNTEEICKFWKKHLA